MINAVVAKHRLMDTLKRASMFEPGRKYLGMSGINGCPLRLYRELLHGRYGQVGERSTLRSLRGNLYEQVTILRLSEAGIYQPNSKKEIVADFDSRFRGHTDGQTVDGDLVEIKSTNHEDFQHVEVRKPLPAHFAQCQMYIKFGGFQHGLLFYVSTETYEHYVLDVYPASQLQAQLISKAQSILFAVDGGPQPQCTCGRCFESRPKSRPVPDPGCLI
jgi:hypothetical protein